MNDARLAAHNKAKLDEMDPEFARRIVKVLAFMKTKGYRCRIVTGWRSPREQAQKVAQGLSKAKVGYHNITTPDGKPRSFAADIVDDNRPYKESRTYYQQLYRAALDQGLQTGIVYNLDPFQITFLTEAVKSGRYDYTGEIGWDPTHVEPALLSVQQALKGGSLPPLPC